MTLDKQVKAKYDYWFEKKPNPALKQKPEMYHTYSVKPEFLSDTIDALKRLAHSRASMIVQEYFGNKATHYEDAFRRNSSDLFESNKIATIGETLAGMNKKHHNSFLEEVIKDRTDFSHLLVTMHLHQPVNAGADFIIVLPFSLENMYPPPSHKLEKALALAGLSNMEDFLKSGEECDMSNLKLYGYSPHGQGLEVKLLDESDMERIEAKAVANSYEVLFEHYKGKDVSQQINEKAALLRRLRELMIDFAESEAIPEERKEPAAPQPFKSELVDLVETERTRDVIFLLNQKEVRRISLPVFITENDTAVADIISKDEEVLELIGKDHYVSDVDVVMRNDDFLICTMRVNKHFTMPEPQKPESEDPVMKDIKTEFSKVPAGRRLESEKRRQAYESFKTKWADDPEKVEEAAHDLAEAFRLLDKSRAARVFLKQVDVKEDVKPETLEQDTSGGQETSS